MESVCRREKLFKGRWRELSFNDEQSQWKEDDHEEKTVGDIWECSVDIHEKGSWRCCIAIDGHKNVVKLPEIGTDRDLYRYGWEGLCCWESV